MMISHTSAFMEREREDAILRSSLKLSGASTKLAAVVAVHNSSFTHFSN